MANIHDKVRNMGELIDMALNLIHGIEKRKSPVEVWVLGDQIGLEFSDIVSPEQLITIANIVEMLDDGDNG